MYRWKKRGVGKTIHDIMKGHVSCIEHFGIANGIVICFWRSVEITKAISGVQRGVTRKQGLYPDAKVEQVANLGFLVLQP